MKPIIVIGHRNPDSDSICSAIGYAHLKNTLGEKAIAGRAGSLNAETQYILDYFQEPWPELIDDFYPRASDVMVDTPVGVLATDSLWKLGKVMHEAHLKSIPVLDQDQKLLGVVSVGDLAKRFFDEMQTLDFSQTGTTFSAVAEVLNGEVLCGKNRLQQTLEGRMKVAGSSLETIKTAFAAGDIVLVGDRPDVHELSIELKVSAIILTSSGGELSPGFVEKAEAAGIIVMRCPYDTYTCARLLNQSIPVSAVMQHSVISFSPDDLLDDVKETIRHTHFRNYPVVEKSKIVGMINRNSLILSEPQPVILVDHNERSQAVEGIEFARVIEIVDHHRLGGLQTNEPIFIRQEPVGCTATIIANMYWHRNIAIPKNIAGILLSAILSDTVLFKSPTSTEKDRVTAEQLAVIAELNMQEHGMALLKAGSSLNRQSPADTIRQDLKEFKLGNLRVSISQVYVMDSGELASKIDPLQKELESLRVQEGYDLALLMVTDILLESTELLATGSPLKLINYAFEIEPQASGTYHLPGVLSRKKQMIPPLGRAAQELR